MKAKRFAAAVLALIMALSLTTMAFATETTPEERKATLTEPGAKRIIDVMGSYDGTGEVVDVYSVNVEWGAMVFTYKTDGKKTWDPENHTYDVDGTSKWVANGDTVKVTNHSNVPVKVDFSFKKDTSADRGTYDGNMSVDTKTLNAGEENKPAAADYIESKLVMNGSLNVNVTTEVVLGTITVTLSAVVEP